MSKNERTKKLQCIVGTLLPKYLLIVLLVLQKQLLEASALPQNPFEAVANGVLTMARSAADLLENGAAVRKDMGIKNDFFEVQHKTEAGMGKAILKPSASDDDYDSDERKRRKRRSALQMHTTSASYHGQQHAREVHKHRGKRSPCHTMMQPSTPSGGDGEDAEDVRRRNARSRSAAQKKSSAKSAKNSNAKSKTKKSTSSSKNKRYRRQAEDAEYLDSVANDAGSKFSQHVKEITRKAQVFFESFFQSMTEAFQQVKQTFSGGGGQRPPSFEDI